MSACAITSSTGNARNNPLESVSESCLYNQRERPEKAPRGFRVQIIKEIKKWYRGRYVPPPDNSYVAFVCPHYEQPILARDLGAVGRFWLAHWKWIVPTIIFPLMGLMYHHFSR
jgi:hypothetical protein